MRGVELNLPDGSPVAFDLATPSQLEGVLRSIRELGRQSMNLRVMKDARLYVARRARRSPDPAETLGWIGVSTGHLPGHAEYFSLFVRPEYRGLGLGLALELLAVEEAMAGGHQYLHFRTSSDVDPRLTASRRRSGTIEEFEPSSVVRSLCRECELFGAACASQTFMRIDVVRRSVQLRSLLAAFRPDESAARTAA